MAKNETSSVTIKQERGNVHRLFPRPDDAKKSGNARSSGTQPQVTRADGDDDDPGPTAA